jgi:hypothetical protein
VLKVLHLRRKFSMGHSYRDTFAGLSALDTFAKWAFGPHGLPMLELLACGDFASPYRGFERGEVFCKALKEVEIRRNISPVPLLYRRSELGYNKILPELDKIDAPTAMLNACPTYNEP